MQDSRTHPSLAIVSGTDEIASSWNSVWGEALEYGTRLMYGFFGALTRLALTSVLMGSTPQPEHLTDYNLDTAEYKVAGR